MTAADIGFKCLSSTNHAYARKKVGLKSRIFGNIFPKKYFVKKKMSVRRSLQLIFSFHCLAKFLKNGYLFIKIG